MTLSNSQKSQLTKRIRFAHKYIPTSQKASEEAWQVRRHIWSFKKGQCQDVHIAAQTVIHLLEENFTRLDDVVLAVIPASNMVEHNDRYRDFCDEVCEATGMTNAFSHIKVQGNRIAIHDKKHSGRLQNTQIISFDEEWFNGKQVIVFDDIITKGQSYAVMADTIEGFGAEVWGGCFLAKTSYC